jgi:parallel beta-helix repeat protein
MLRLHVRLSACLLAATALPALAPAATLHVPANYATIQAAMEAAASGDIVQVAAGTYGDCTHPTEGPGSTPACVIMRSGVTLRGAGINATIIDADSQGRGIFVELVSNCRIENLQVTRAYAAVYGAGILLRQVDASVVIDNVKVIGCTDGGIICINNASPTISNVLCLDNEAKQGGGIAIEESSSPIITSCRVSGNQAPSGGGVFIRQNSNPHISGCTIDLNDINAVWGAGGGIAIVDSAPILSNCMIQANTALGYGGGISYLDGQGGEMSDCKIIGNDVAASYNFGGGIYIGGANPILRRCVIAQNTASGLFAEGGGVTIDFAPTVRLENCTIAGNAAINVLCQYGATPTLDKCIIAFATSGSGLVCSGATPTVSCSNIYGNPGGNAVCGVNAGGNFSADPLFCGTIDREYNLQPGSPCLPGNHPGGPGTCGDALIGALGSGCGQSDVAELPAMGLRLTGIAPNPFNPRTTIFFVLAEPAAVTLRVFDAVGRLVTARALGELPAGPNETVWRGQTDAGRAVPSGVYFCELEALGMKQTQRMLLVR